ncbi:MAG: hypothetical protein H6564_07780 [Lewinellaceae bacterium]|nr:hypothetical protein [Lewinellaceae bacterium]
MTDVNGNTCSAVTVQDNAAPTASCQNVTVQLNAGGSRNAACQPGVSPNAAPTWQRRYADGDGCERQCSATVTVQDNIAPTASCQNVTVQLNAGGSASVTATQVNNGSSDNCGIASLSASPSSFDCGDIGSNTVTLTVTDVNNNSSSCTANVTVEDNIAPDPVCLANTVYLDPSGHYTLLDTDVLDFEATTDNCGEFYVSAIGAETFDCDDADQTFTVPVTVSDGSGNTTQYQLRCDDNSGSGQSPTGAVVQPGHRQPRAGQHV